MRENPRKKQKREKSNKKGFNAGLQLQITIPFVILIIIAVGVVAALSYNSSVRTTTDELSNSIESQISSVNETFNLYFSNMENHLTRMSNESGIRHYNGEDFNALYASLQESNETDPHIRM